MYKIVIAGLLLAAVFAFIACSKKPIKGANSSEAAQKPDTEQGKELPQQTTATVKPEYKKISAEKAKEMMNSSEDIVLLDVRSKAEYDEKHIEGALLIPDNELENRAAGELGDINATILVYCRSGNRSKTAAKLLVKLGYTAVYDFGGINEYPYDTV